MEGRTPIPAPHVLSLCLRRGSGGMVRRQENQGLYQLWETKNSTTYLSGSWWEKLQRLKLRWGGTFFLEFVRSTYVDKFDDLSVCFGCGHGASRFTLRKYSLR